MSLFDSGKRQWLKQILLLFLTVLPFHGEAEERMDGPLTTAEALKAFQLEPGIRIELVAAEPAVVDPVAVAFDEGGRMFVAENRGYPTGPSEGEPPIGVIALLEDRDSNGTYETRTVFAEGLTFPNGVMPWKGGILVTCAPDLLFLKDTNNDGRADERRVVFTGFDAKNTTQLRVSHPTLSIDNWIYVTSGLTGGNVRSSNDSAAPAVEVKSDFRFTPDLRFAEPVDGRAQFGLSFDDAGHRFICYNRVHIQHVVVPSRYLRRNPDLPFSDTVHNVPEMMTPEPLKGHGASARIFPISRNVTTADSHAGTFTAACGLIIYRGQALPADFWGNAFACDPTANLVHRDRLRAIDATFGAQPGREGVEFVASTDNWFRPVNLALGPDGALYISDMYRRTIEHPQYLPEEIRKRTDFVSGNDKGRIYRVSAASSPAYKSPRFDLFSGDVRQLCEQLENPNGWWRDTAQRLILERQDRSCIPVLREQVGNRRSRAPISRLHALRALEALEALDERTLSEALRDPLSAVREHALQLAEARFKSTDPQSNWLERVLPLATDPDARVRFQCALTLGELPDSRGIPALAGIAIRGAQDRWTRAAVLSSVSGREHAFARAVLDLAKNSESASEQALLFDLGRVLGAALSPESLQSLVAEVLISRRDLHRACQRSLLSGLVVSGKIRGLGTKDRFRVVDLFAGNSKSPSTIRERIAELIKQSQDDALDERQSLTARLSAIAFLQQADFSTVGDLLLRLLDVKQPLEVQTAAVESLLQISDREIIAILLKAERWAQYTPAVREALVASSVSNASRAEALLAAVDTGEVPVWAVSGAHRNQLLKSRDLSVRARAESLFKPAQQGDRMKVFEQVKSALTAAADGSRGHLLFKQYCASCHRLDREGVAVGPDLFGIRNQPKEAILLHIIIPELEIVPGFTAYEIQTTDGRELSGLIVSETATSITLRGATGKDELLLRSSMASIHASQLSLMPQGFEASMTRQDLADLVAYLKGEAPNAGN